MAKEASWLDVFVGLTLAFFVGAPVCALIVAATASTLWGWFLSPQYGVGPNYAAWYGIALLVSLMTARVKRDKVDSESVVVVALAEIVLVVIVCLLTLAMAAMVKAMNGW